MVPPISHVLPGKASCHRCYNPVIAEPGSGRGCADRLCATRSPCACHRSPRADCNTSDESLQEELRTHGPFCITETP